MTSINDAPSSKRWGLEPNCPSCVAAVSEQHEATCDVARCLTTGWQRRGCSEAAPEQQRGSNRTFPDCGHDVWTGRWPGEEECVEFGWFARLDPAHGWVPCAAEAPGAAPDLNRLHTEGVWNPHTVRFDRRNPAEPVS